MDDPLACDCAPCGRSGGRERGREHNHYYSFMGRPGAFCASIPGPPCNHSFTAIAKRTLRNKRVLIYGDSVPTQVFFAMLCDLHRHGMISTVIGKKGATWPDGDDRIAFNNEGLLPVWDAGVFVPALGLTLRLLHQTRAAQQFCHAREVAIAKERVKYERTGHKNYADLAGVLPSRPCAAFFASAAREYDVLIANVLGTGVLFHRPNLREIVHNDTRTVLSELAAAAAANSSKRMIVTTNAAQHFAQSVTASRSSGGGSGLYESRDQRQSAAAGCYCAPSAAGSTDPRNDVLHSLWAEMAAPHVRLHDSYKLFQPYWFMHIARTVAEHPRANTTRDSPVCDCTHYCFMPAFWSQVYWPALQGALE